MSAQERLIRPHPRESRKRHRKTVDLRKATLEGHLQVLSVSTIAAVDLDGERPNDWFGRASVKCSRSGTVVVPRLPVDTWRLWPSPVCWVLFPRPVGRPPLTGIHIAHGVWGLSVRRSLCTSTFSTSLPSTTVIQRLPKPPVFVVLVSPIREHVTMTSTRLSTHRASGLRHLPNRADFISHTGCRLVI